MYQNKDDIRYALNAIDNAVGKINGFAHIQIVGSAALMCQDIEIAATTDIDNIHEIRAEIQEIIDDLGIDLNNDAMDYIDNYQGRYFFDLDEYQHLRIECLDAADVFITKMMNLDDETKMSNLAYTLLCCYDVAFDTDSIVSFLEETFDASIEYNDRQIISEWIDKCIQDEIVFLDDDGQYALDTYSSW